MDGLQIGGTTKEWSNQIENSEFPSVGITYTSVSVILNAKEVAVLPGPHQFIIVPLGSRVLALKFRVWP